MIPLSPRLLALGVQLLREKLLTNSVERTILREKIYNCVLDYFCYEPLWPVDDTVVVRETVATLIKFWVSVRDMKNASIVSLSCEDHVICGSYHVTCHVTHSLSSGDLDCPNPSLQ